MTTKVRQAEQQEAIARLRECLKPGDTVYTSIKKVSGSGMYRHIAVYKFECRDGQTEALWLSYNVAKALGWSFKDATEAVGVGGVGMDMGFHLVYELSRVLFREGYGCTGSKCQSSDHQDSRDFATYDEWREKGFIPHSDEHSHWHRDSGYALKQKWL